MSKLVSKAGWAAVCSGFGVIKEERELVGYVIK